MDRIKPVIFLSASMPTKERDSRFFDTADFIAIRDAVVALVNAIIPNYSLIWGGHPAITTIIHEIFKKRGFGYNDFVTIYQSAYFAGNMPKENQNFDNVIITDAIRKYETESQNRIASLSLMRQRMLTDSPIFAGIFIGGMEGVIDEYELLKKYNPSARAYPIASTGAAAYMLYCDLLEQGELKGTRLLNDFCYSSLFDDILKKGETRSTI